MLFLNSNLKNIAKLGQANLKEKQLNYFSKFYFASTDSNNQDLSAGPTKKHKFNVLFFGNDEISLPTAAKLYEDSFSDDSVVKSIGVVTTPVKNKKSTQSIFHRFLDEKRIEKYELNIKTKETLKGSWREIINTIKEKDYNIGIIASFGKMLPGSIIVSLKHGAFVMHPSLLPKYRGASPIQHCLLNEEVTTGISIAEASIAKFDAGDILLKKEVEIEKFHRFKELSLILSHMGGSQVVEFLRNYEEFNKNKAVQDDSPKKIMLH